MGLRVIKKNLTKKSIELMNDIAEDKEDYKKFYEQFAKNIKLGIHEDSTNRNKLAELLRYTSTKSGEDITSLKEYVARMEEDQPGIYYITGESKKVVETSPFLEKLKKRGYEVLYMTDPIDEYAVQHMDEFEDHKLMNATKEDLKFGDKEEKKEKKRREKAKENLKDLIEWYKKLLGDSVEKIVISNRLTTSPMAVVTGQYGYTANMERLMKAQALNDPSRYSFMASKKTVEINPYHPVISSLKDKAKEDPESDETKELAQMLYDSALIQAGFDIEDQGGFGSRMMKMLKKGLNVDEDAKAEEEPEDDAEEEEEEKKEGDEEADEEKPKEEL